MARILDFTDGFESSVAPAASGVAASTITNTPSGNLSATTVQGALNELQSDIDTRLPKVTATDNAVTRFDGTTGLVQNSSVTVSDAGDVVIPGDLTVQGTTVTINSTTLDVKDPNITINKGGNDTSAQGAGIDVERTGTHGSLKYDSALASKFKIGALGSESQVADVSSAQTLTNKTLTSPSITTPTGIVKGDVGLGNVDNTSDATKNAAAVTLTNKTLTSPVINTPTGIVKGDVGLGNVDNTSDATKNAAAVVLTNKDHDGGTASNTSRLTLPKATKATLDALTRKEGTIAYGTDTAKAYVDNGTNLVAIGSGSGGGALNYLSANSDAETDTSGYATYKDAAAALPVDGTGGSATLTFTRSTSSPLRGTANFLITHSAANLQGEGVSALIAIDRADQGKQLSIGFDYEVASGTYATGDLGIYIFDVSNSVVIQPSGYQVVNVGGQGTHTSCVFQAASNSTSYRICWHVATSTATAYTMKVDNITVGPQVVPVGAAMSDWVAYTPTFGGFGTPTSVSFRSRRVGDSLEISGYFVAGTTTAAAATISLGYNGVNGGLTIDSTKIPAAASSAIVGNVSGNAGGTDQIQVLAVAGNAFINLGVQGGVSGYAGMTLLFGSSFASSGNTFSLHAKVPITGWSSNRIVSDSAATRVVAMTAKIVGSGPAISGTYSDVLFTTTTRDTHGGYNAATGEYTVKVPGEYRIDFQSLFTDAASAAGNVFAAQVLKNGVSQYSATNQVSGDYVFSLMLPYQDYYVAGDKIKIQVKSTATSPFLSNPIFIVSMLQGPAQIQAATIVAMRATGSPPTGTIGAAYNTVIFGTVATDTTGSYVAATGIWTCPAPGYYDIKASFAIAGTSSTGAAIRIDKNNGTELVTVPSGIATSNVQGFNVATDGVLLNAGDTIRIKSYTDATGPSYNSAYGTSSFSIKRNSGVN